MALTWYVTVVAWSDSWMQAISRSFRKAGLPLFDRFDPASWKAVKWTLLATSAVLLVAYVANAVRLWRAHLAGALATAGQPARRWRCPELRSRHPEDRVAGDLERAIRADVGQQTQPSQ